ncbi:hypothetical protein ACIA59_10605 [Micromonospora haikouensis]|uniref:hypothetical protein n=1 Tax=Micromonospora haikouensis TaxID=686309 RepID=UPI00379D5DFD
MAVIEVLTGIAGDDFSWRRGQLVELDQADAEQWADGRRARLVDLQPPVRETTTRPVPEHDVPPPGPARETAVPPATPERTGDPERPSPPPRKGPGSGDKAWQQYAAAWQVDVPDGARREDIWPLLDAAGVPTE